jgi:hypothetical protein
MCVQAQAGVSGMAKQKPPLRSGGQMIQCITVSWVLALLMALSLVSAAAFLIAHTNNKDKYNLLLNMHSKEPLIYSFLEKSIH